MKLDKKKLSHYRELFIGALGAICVLGGLGHFLDWFKERHSVDLRVSIGFLAVGCVLILALPNRLKAILYTLLTIVGWGILGAIASRSLLGLFIIVPCTILSYLLIRWKGHLMK